jgi:hypothetical protein
VKEPQYSLQRDPERKESESGDNDEEKNPSLFLPEIEPR